MYCLEILNSIDVIVTEILNSLGLYGPLLGSLLILVESIIPILPLSVFITLNFYAFGNFMGFFISSILTIIGCNLSFYLCRKILSNRIEFLTKKIPKRRLKKLLTKFGNIKLANLVLLMAFPFTPAFLINVLSGTSKMDSDKFLIASILGKPFMVYFWGYIGTTFLQSFTHPTYFVKIILLLLVAYLISKGVNKKFSID